MDDIVQAEEEAMNVRPIRSDAVTIGAVLGGRYWQWYPCVAKKSLSLGHYPRTHRYLGSASRFQVGKYRPSYLVRMTDSISLGCGSQGLQG